ncbi:hypothetical protein DXT99_24425 [Pontibacter diazotrophicus]|uniref:Uncharacterized protein n=1 Tax=Pontibacter diazotrophicus TaxID=1400979 RepID=A0A3D8L2B3_9BACT|nr:hypothetical protein [Pontibacter diazotrophicus]RDV11483.1 hypothetical protein DXT99_24425 [Pontibacter diazotrophicus]
MIRLSDNRDPSARFEGLLRYAFNCGKAEDPFGYARQEEFSGFVDEIRFSARRALATGLIKLVIDNPDNEYTDRLKELETSVWEAKTQDQIIQIIDAALRLMNDKESKH